MDSLQVRRATPFDIDFLAWCNYESSSPKPGFCYWDPLLEGLNTPTMSFIKAVFQSDALAFGRVSEFFVVEESGKPIAGGSGFTMDAEDYRPLCLSSIPAVAERLGWTDDQQEQFLERYQNVWRDPQDSSLAPHTSWIIECVAVVPEARGRGLTRKLFEGLFTEGRRLGHSHVGISVTKGNDIAERAYQSIGFQMYISYGADYFDGYFPGTTKYRLCLS
jgi:ribosomal protein S18 acetylase RimI-like enzyme